LSATYDVVTVNHHTREGTILVFSFSDRAGVVYDRSIRAALSDAGRPQRVSPVELGRFPREHHRRRADENQAGSREPA